MFRRIALLVTIILCTSIAVAQPLPPSMVEEAPESLLELELGDSEVDLYISGGWTTGIGGGTGIAWFRDANGNLQGRFPESFPGLETVPFFNTVNLAISLWLMQRAFFETSIADDFAVSSILFGYAGMPGELVNSVLIGNTAIDMGAYPYLGFGDSTGVIGRDAPGASAVLQTERTEHEIMVRLEPATETELSHAGGRIVSTQDVDATAWVSNRFFILPDADIETLSVYAEDADGSISGSDGRTYRVVDIAAECAFSLLDGTVSFNEAPDGRILVYYEVGGLPVGDPVLGEDSFFLLTNGNPDSTLPGDLSFDAPEDLLSAYGENVTWSGLSPGEQSALRNTYFAVDLDGVRALVLHEPGRWNPFETAGFYRAPVTVSDEVQLSFVTAGRDLPLSLPLVIESGGDDLVRVVHAGDDPRSFASHYPFAAASLTTPLPELYGPSAQQPPTRPAIRFTEGVPASSILLESSYIPGSVRVSRNGVPTDAFIVQDNGELTFDTELTAIDAVTVRYRRAESSGAGDVLVGTGNTFAFTPEFTGQVAGGLRWKPISSSYSTTPAEYPGYLALSASGEYAGETLSAWFSAGASYSVTDTTGVLRAEGMNGELAVTRMVPGALYPAPVPATDPDETDGLEITGNTRGALYASDFTASGFMGQREIQSYLWEPPTSQVYPYEDGGRIGPYAALSYDLESAGSSVDVMVMEYNLEEAENWVGAVARIPGGTEMDLGGATRIEGAFRLVEGSEDVRIFIQAGATAEDLDADGAADTGASVVDPSFTFNDTNTGYRLAAGPVYPPSDDIYTEDADDDGRSDPELADMILTLELPAASVAGGWTEFSFDLDSEQRSRLASSRGIRYIVQRDAAAGTRSGKIVFSNVTFHGSAFTAAAPPAANVHVVEIPESQAGGTALSDAYPAVAAQLEDDEATPQVLRITWNGLAAQSFTVRTPTELVRATDYEELVLYLRGPADGTTVTVTASDQDDIPISRTTVPVTGDWTEISVPLPDPEGAGATGVSPDNSDRLPSERVVATVVLELAGSDAGSILVDEIIFRGARSSQGVAGEAGLRWTPETNVTVGPVTVLDRISARQTVRARSDGYARVLSGGTPGVEATTEVSATVLGAPARVGLATGLSSGEPGLQVDHDISVPVPPLRTTFSDAFRRSYLTYGETLTHNLSLSAGPYGPLRLAAGWFLDNDGAENASSWDASVALRSATTPRVNITVSGTASQTSGGTPPAVAYPAAWARSFALIAPVSGVSSGRNAGIATEFSLAGSSTSLEADMHAGSAIRAGVGAIEATAGAGVALPVVVGDRVRLEAGLAREAGVTSTHAGTSFTEDARSAWEILGAQTYMASSWPVWELADPALITTFAESTAGAQEAEYATSVTISMSRPVRSSPWSLLVPSSARITAQSSLTRRNDAVTQSRSLAAKVSAIAPNVFGRLGTHPLFTFYDTDEQTGTLGAEITSSGSGESEIDLSLDHAVTLLWLSGEKLSMETTASGIGTVENGLLRADPEANVTVDGAFAWSRDAEFATRMKRVPPEAAAQATLEHEETLSWDGAWAEGSEHMFTVKHTTALHLGDLGSISVYGGLGLGFQRDPGLTLFRTGLQAGIEGSVSF